MQLYFVVMNVTRKWVSKKQEPLVLTNLCLKVARHLDLVPVMVMDLTVVTLLRDFTIVVGNPPATQTTGWDGVMDMLTVR